MISVESALFFLYSFSPNESFFHSRASYSMKTSPEVPTDAALITRIKAGDERAFNLLVKRYEQTVWGFAFKLCRDQDKAQESFQDTFINVFRKIDQFDARSKFSTWLYTIVANNCLMNRRKRKLESLLESFDDAPDVEDEHVKKQLAAWDDSPIETMMNKEMREQMDAAIQELPDEYRVVFVLRDLEEKTAEETAKILKLSVPAVKSRLRRSRIFLRHKLHGLMAA
jgi:RNA polymerase sigma-70 factor (ECF subfamily)